MSNQSMQYIARNCPICNTSTGIVKMQSAQQAEKMDWADVQESWSGLLKEKSFFSYRRCGGCGLSYNPSYFSATQLNELYGSMAPNMDDVSVDQLRATQQGYFDLAKPYLVKEGGGYLELGPDVGYFAKACSDSQRMHPYWLIEPNLAVWDALRSCLNGNETHILAALDDIDSIPDRSLRFVVAIHVMDHLTNPREILSKIHGKMTKNGIFLSVTHDEGSLMAKALQSRWPPYCLQHPQLYNRDSIRKLFETSGYSVKRVVKSVNHFPLGFLVQQAMWALLKIRLKRLGFLDSIHVGLRLGNIATIASPNEVK